MGEAGGLFPHEGIQQLVTKVLLKLGELYPSERIHQRTPAGNADVLMPQVLEQTF